VEGSVVAGIVIGVGVAITLSLLLVLFAVGVISSIPGL
jgi:hypothetical protein